MGSPAWLMQLLLSVLLVVGSRVRAAPGADSSRNNNNSNNTYDYIVVGSGPGGGPVASNLAQNGFSVLLIEAGDDQSDNILTKVPVLSLVEPNNNRLHWDFYVRHYADLNRTLQHHFLTWRLPDGSLYVGPGQNPAPPAGATLLGVYYPRGATLGGSAVINYLVTVLPPDSDWQNIADMTGDQAWSPANMHEIWQRVERNHYVNTTSTGHGFNGFIDTILSVGDGSVYRNEPTVVAVLKSMMSVLGLDPNKFYEYIFGDINALTPNRDKTQGLWAIPYTANQLWRRVTARDLILATVNATKADGTQKYPLYLQLNTLATKIIFDQNRGYGRQPRAVGVEYLHGQSLYKADPRHASGTQGVAGKAYARKEVIVSGGTFNSPQLLKLSGIGPRAELQKLQIPVVVDLPGVGAHMMDNPEIPIVGLAKQDFVSNDTSLGSCFFGAPGDPCVAQWEQGQGPYAAGQPNSNAMMRTTPYSVDGDRDMFVFSGAFTFRGFLPPVYTTNLTRYITDPPNTFGIATVKMQNQNRAGTVLLRSADPQDTPDINFNYFTDGADIDLGAIDDTVKWGRRAHAGVAAPLGPLNTTEPPCPSSLINADGSCRDSELDKEWIMNQAFGHHPTSTCAIGADGDGYAVLDSRLRVRGVDGLRVVDASAHPRTPGAFPMIPTYMLSLRASDFILADAGRK
ncbi:GMC oxidoreductase [Diplogelasinospora grovesii]|uniref:GMC oxidoreductase n=1 Tax=Diplogelasinospora grovesii TaxID=303347 RepID=A0AAN6N4I9_9PEZI|nr:GMC oxidoreductase [Diplogelasinospora grovesii]